MLTQKWLIVASMLLCSTIAQDITQSDKVVNIEENVDNNEQKEIKQRQGPQQPGWGGLISGLLGSITKTAEVNECPGKCLHALASLLCEEVREDISCPASTMRCCVDRRNTPEGAEDAGVENTTKKRLRPPPPPPRTTPRTTTTTTPPTTTRRPVVQDVASNKQDKFGDYEYTDDESNLLTSNPASEANRFMTSAFLFCSSFIFFLF